MSGGVKDIERGPVLTLKRGSDPAAKRAHGGLETTPAGEELEKALPGRQAGTEPLPPEGVHSQQVPLEGVSPKELPRG